MKYLNKFENYIKKNYIGTSEIKGKYVSAMNILSIEECVNYTIKNCQEFINNPKKISRFIGYFSSDSFTSKPIDRKSRDNANYYTLLIDNTPSWRDYPKRSKSFIATLCTIRADLNNMDYLVIPNDGSMWGICPKNDIYYSFNNFNDDIYTIRNFFDGINDLSMFLNLGGISDNTYNEMLYDIKKLQKNICDRFESDSSLLSYLGKLLSEKFEYTLNAEKAISYINFWEGSLMDQLTEIIDPEINKFKLMKYIDISSDDISHEVWTDSPCLFIHQKHIHDFLFKLRNKTKKEINL
jgi:hypothetical protein